MNTAKIFSATKQRFAASAIALASLFGAPAAAQVMHILEPVATTMSSARYAEIEANATPMEQIVGELPNLDVQVSLAPALTQRSMASSMPAIRGPHRGRPVRYTVDERENTNREGGGGEVRGGAPGVQTQAGVSPQNYGQGNLNSIFHYNDYLQFPAPVYYEPYRSAGKLFFTFNGTSWFSCTAALIDRAILVTAGHCVHQGGNGADGFIQQGYFVPSYRSQDGASQRYGRCDILRTSTTTGWANEGNIQNGYDVATALCGRTHSARWGAFNRYLMGGRMGHFGFCFENCRMQYQFLTQIGYPGNYYGGGAMTVGQHLETTATGTDDYIHGSGMRGGSSGGPHVSNIGVIYDTSTSQGQLTTRNVIYAVTSWGYTSHDFKIQGASPLSGVNNANNFRVMFNQMCWGSRHTYGAWSCNPLPIP